MDSSVIAMVVGLGTGLGLIVAIGAQNAFVLRQGLRSEHVIATVAVCAASDAVLIALGVSGLGELIRLWPRVLSAIAILGGLFLLGYGFLAARRALSPTTALLSGSSARTARSAVLTCLALTWLNPHVYLDTVLLLGSVANQYGPRRWLVAAGAIMASVLWFAALGFGARLLRPMFTQPRAWRVLDGLIAATMTALGVTLLLGQA